MENPIVSVHCIVCVLICFVSMIFPFSNIDIPINCFPEIIKPPPLLLASDVDVYLKTTLYFKGILKGKRDNNDKYC